VTDEQVFEASRTWSYELYERLYGSRRLSWICTGIAVCFAGGCLLALLWVLQRADRPPIVLTQDCETKHVQVGHTLGSIDLEHDEGQAKAGLLQYVLARETYDPQDLQPNYELVYAMSTKEAWRPYEDSLDRERPGNLLERYQKHTSVRVRIKQITLLEADRGLVRFATTTRTGEEQWTEHWAATVLFGFGARSSDLTELARNPLGFEVRHYRRDQEALLEEVRHVDVQP